MKSAVNAGFRRLASSRLRTCSEACKITFSIQGGLMTPISPVIEGHQDREVVYAKDQPQYNPLPALRTPEGVVLTRWTLTNEERDAISMGADVLLEVHTFGRAIMPVRLSVATGDEMDDKRLQFGI
jgi:hypothetical protein